MLGLRGEHLREPGGQHQAASDAEPGADEIAAAVSTAA
jgi:hypothetical protein